MRSPISQSVCQLALHLIGLLTFSLPFLLSRSSAAIFKLNNGIWFALGLSLIAVIGLIQQISRQLLDSKIIAIVGILAAVISGLRLLGAGALGIEPIWFLIILSARALGPQIGMSLAMISIMSSALLSGGVGPWLSYQILAAGWIAYGVWLIPKRLTNRGEIIALACYGIFSSFLFGILMDLQLWPWLTGIDTQLSYQDGASIAANVQRFIMFHFATSMSWDIPRAIFTATLIVLTGRAVLATLRRALVRLNVREIPQAALV